MSLARAVSFTGVDSDRMAQMQREMQGNELPEGVPARFADMSLDKFAPGGLLIVRAGGPAGLFSAIIGGWPGTVVRDECQSVTKEIKP